MKNIRVRNLVMAFATMLSVYAWADNAGRFAPLTETRLADGRDIVTTIEGRTVYTFDVDEPGVSNCNGGCAKVWPPVLVSSADGLKEPMGVTTRQDGTLQLMIDKKPVYLFMNDKAQGDILGDGLNGVWHIIVD